ncbi:MAG: hypothetical protein MNSN_02830 [Minisyncoccus archaeiphilus]|uniref:hypothetical protein n=1 Tax=Minisyncoccus archaeiphilus TaxID=3238481 RepID=UPI002B0C4E48|nr:MAG: hypothetical protein MNSN_02830 [Candidatus Parcubacteria bacterium]
MKKAVTILIIISWICSPVFTSAEMLVYSDDDKDFSLIAYDSKADYRYIIPIETMGTISSGERDVITEEFLLNSSSDIENILVSGAGNSNQTQRIVLLRGAYHYFAYMEAREGRNRTTERLAVIKTDEVIKYLL